MHADAAQQLHKKDYTMSMSISGRRIGNTFEVVDERGVQQVVKLQNLTVNGQWRGGDSTYQIQCTKEGVILSITESSEHSTRTPEDEDDGKWNDAEQGRWENMSPLAVTQQPISDKTVQLFSATKINGQKGDVRLFRFDPQYPYDLEVSHITRDPERPVRTVQILRRHISARGKL